MNFEFIGRSTVKVTLSENDLAKRGLCYDMLESENADTKKLISDISEELLIRHNINIIGEKLYIEVFHSGGGCVMYISESSGKISSARSRFADIDCLEIIFSARDIAELVETAKMLKKELGMFISDSELYYSDECFFIILSISRAEVLRVTEILNCHNGTPLCGGSGIRAAYIREHYTPILYTGAIVRLSCLS